MLESEEVSLSLLQGHLSAVHKLSGHRNGSVILFTAPSRMKRQWGES